MAGLVLVLHAGLIFVSHRLLVTPLRRLVDATRVLAEGGHDLQLPVAKTSELIVLTDAFREMSHSVWQMQDSARSANPLSGLPGNVEIEKHVRQRMSTGEYFSVLYCDLDSFKAYNGMGVSSMMLYLSDRENKQLVQQALDNWHKSLEINSDQPKIKKLVQRYMQELQAGGDGSSESP